MDQKHAIKKGKRARDVLGIANIGSQSNNETDAHLSDIHMCYKEFIEDYLKPKGIKNPNYSSPHLFRKHLVQYIANPKKS